ncbi:flagellar hook-length control protein FliK [Rickettsiales endosymbiont of Stachyamoeba lipophora]|uniref:flagellar hook-length control protein FliK n=1 Tax=Rickettsiales endosymbiont of Stachyamoeba lipophora TaxID=2486578 RepID=UPI000F64516F|nr:flagellar hook-length control protein FliK [Rickettsiales endosymbiont of Stachyamoeba lipophora]AZL16243.1 flagellar hook-length control protein FliK [Rickettsiales endosymbiont of Stachyamoeba lipophora]
MQTTLLNFNNVMPYNESYERNKTSLNNHKQSLQTNNNTQKVAPSKEAKAHKSINVNIVSSSQSSKIVVSNHAGQSKTNTNVAPQVTIEQQVTNEQLIFNQLANEISELETTLIIKRDGVLNYAQIAALNPELQQLVIGRDGNNIINSELISNRINYDLAANFEQLSEINSNQNTQQDYEQMGMVGFDEFLNKNSALLEQVDPQAIAAGSVAVIQDEAQKLSDKNVNNDMGELITLGQGDEQQAIEGDQELARLDSYREFVESSKLIEQQIKNNVIKTEKSTLQLSPELENPNKKQQQKNWQNFEPALDNKELLSDGIISENSAEKLAAEQINNIITANFKNSAEEAPQLNLKVELFKEEDPFKEVLMQVDQDINELEARLNNSFTKVSESSNFEQQLNQELLKQIEVSSGELPHETQNIKNPLPLHDQVRIGITKGINDNNGKVVLQLDPHHLGKVEITMSFNENRIAHLTIQAEKKEALELLQKDFGVLEKNLDNNGIKIAESNISFNLMNDSRQDSKQNREFMEDYRETFKVSNVDTDDNYQKQQQLVLNAYQSTMESDKLDILV